MFQPGISGNPRGRPRGSLSGRAQVLAVLDRILSQECNQQVIFDALEKELPADPSRFFRNTVVPLIPRAALDAPASDALDDGQPLDRHPQSTPPPVPPVPSVHPPSVRSPVLFHPLFNLLFVVINSVCPETGLFTPIRASTSNPQTLKRSHVSHAHISPVSPLLFVVINSHLRPPAPSPHTLPNLRTLEL